MRFTRVAANQLKKSKWREATIRDNYKKDTFVAHVCKFSLKNINVYEISFKIFLRAMNGFLIFFKDFHMINKYNRYLNECQMWCF